MKTKVRFIEGRQGGLGVLEVSTPIDRPLGTRVTSLINMLGLRVAHAERQQGDQRLVERWVLTETDGSSINDLRRAQIQALLFEEMGSALPPPPSSPEHMEIPASPESYPASAR
ncbi:MAG TPA: hypothetical protein VL137_18380 [Polyangiaceae bacterium]|nr:hypothetical protein [Polyangiaceae bacterium]